MNYSYSCMVIKLGIVCAISVLLSAEPLTAEYNLRSSTSASNNVTTAMAAETQMNQSHLDIADDNLIQKKSQEIIAFLSNRGATPTSTGDGDIYIMNADGSDVTSSLTNIYCRIKTM